LNKCSATTFFCGKINLKNVQKFKNYKQTLDFMYAQLPMYHRVGAAAYKPDLTNTIEFCSILGNPQSKFPSIHVAGTNGKGSVSHILASILQSAGLKVGLYISPHYKDFRERIKINGQYIPKKTVTNFVNQQFDTIEKIEPSFFEMTVGMAFDYFAKQKVDIAVIEVGLGGRLDSTNIILPEISVITNISFDHMSMLGTTLPQISYEKAGIIKQNIPVIIGETNAETAPVFLKKAITMNAPITFADQLFRAESMSVELNEGTITHWLSTSYEVFDLKKSTSRKLKINASGPFQQKNLATVLQAIDVLRSQKKWSFVTDEHISNGLEFLKPQTNFIGRWHVVQRKKPMILADSAHNEAGLKLAFAEIEKANFDRLLIVTGFVNDKDLDAALVLFPKNAQYFFAKANIPRGLDAQVLKEKAATFGLVGKKYARVKTALTAAKKAAGAKDLVLIIGSIFVVGEVI
jgi:dihydrofolate synthase / folylpolyglutamate synthase